MDNETPVVEWNKISEVDNVNKKCLGKGILNIINKAKEEKK